MAEFLNTKQAAEYLGVSLNTLYYLNKENKVKRYQFKNGKNLFYKKTDLDEFLNNNLKEVEVNDDKI